MSAAVTLSEIKTLVADYLIEESKHTSRQSVEDALNPVLSKISYDDRNGTASLELKAIAKVINHFLKEAHKSRASTLLFLINAFDQLRGGHDVPQAIKRGRTLGLKGVVPRKPNQARGMGSPVIHIDTAAFQQVPDVSVPMGKMQDPNGKSPNAPAPAHLGRGLIKPIIYVEKDGVIHEL